jgi:hypothetical protein
MRVSITMPHISGGVNSISSVFSYYFFHPENDRISITYTEPPENQPLENGLTLLKARVIHEPWSATGALPSEDTSV